MFKIHNFLFCSISYTTVNSISLNFACVKDESILCNNSIEEIESKIKPIEKFYKKFNKRYFRWICLFLLLSYLNNYIFTNNEIKIVSLNENEWFKYKDIRLNAVKNCAEAFGTSYEEELKENQEDWINRLKHNMLFAIKNNKVIGMIGAVIPNSEKKRHRALIISFYIEPEERQNGIGSFLLNNLINSLKIKYNFLKFLDLYVTTNQEEAIKLYKKFGFNIEHRLDAVYCINDKYYDQFFMSKKLRYTSPSTYG